MGAGDGPSTEVMKRYAEAGVTRLIVAAASSSHSDGVKAVQGVAPIVERAAKA
jgi:hypothetical protein